MYYAPFPKYGAFQLDLALTSIDREYLELVKSLLQAASPHNHMCKYILAYHI